MPFQVVTEGGDLNQPLSAHCRAPEANEIFNSLPWETEFNRTIEVIYNAKDIRSRRCRELATG